MGAWNTRDNGEIISRRDVAYRYSAGLSALLGSQYVGARLTHLSAKAFASLSNISKYLISLETHTPLSELEGSQSSSSYLQLCDTEYQVSSKNEQRELGQERAGGTRAADVRFCEVLGSCFISLITTCLQSARIAYG